MRPFKRFLKFQSYLLVVSGFIVLAIFGDLLLPNHSVDFQHYQDKSGILPLAGILELEEHNWDEEKSFSSFFQHERESHWFRVRVPDKLVKGSSWYLELPYSYIFEFSFFAVQDSKLLASRDSTNKLDPLNQKSYPTFEFASRIDEPIDLYINTKSFSIMLVNFNLMSKGNYMKWDVFRTFLIGSLVGCMLSLVIYNFFLYITTREINYLVYTFAQIFISIQAFLYSGFNFNIFPTSFESIYVSAQAYWFSLSLAVALLAYNITTYLELKRNSPKQHAIIMGMFYINIFLSMGVFFFPLYVQAYLSLITAFAFSCLIMPVIFQLIESQRFKKLTFAWVGFCIAAILNIAPTFNIIPANSVVLNLAIIGALWEAVFISLALGERIEILKAEKETVKGILTGDLPKSKLNEIMEMPHALSYNLVEKKVVIMFIDIVGFSYSSEKVGSLKIFPELTKKLNEISSIIRKHGGNIDRSLGDGVLCFFEPKNDNQYREQLGLALKAAVEIQQSSMRTASVALSMKRIILPLRIGINCDTVVIGNLGGDNRVDYTMIGVGVNFAQRLESACAPFKIMLSQSSYEQIPDDVLEADGLNSIQLKIKHHDEYLQAMEYNPFHERSAELMSIEREFYSQMNQERKSQRDPIAAKSIRLKTVLGVAEVVDFSEDGFGIILDTLVSNSTDVEAEIISGSEELNKKLSNMLLNHITVQIRWSSVTKDKKYKHGVKINGLNKEQKAAIYETLSLHNTNSVLTIKNSAS